MFNFNLNWDAIADFSTNFDPVAFEKELAAIVNIMTVTAVNSPAVVDAPKNTAPSSAAVQTVVNQVTQAVAPIVAPSVPPRIITKLEDISVGAVLDNPQIKASPAGSTVSSAVVNNITSSISSTFKNDAQKDLELRKAIQESIDDIPPSVKATPTPTKTPAYTPDAQDIRDPKTGLTPAQVEAQKAIEEAQRVASAAGIKTELVTPAGKAGTIKILSEETKQQNFTGRGISNDPLMADGKAFTGNRNGIEYKNGVAVDATREDILQADREARMKAEAEARAKSNPLYNFANRPTAQAPDDNYIYYYSWIGGANTGEWRLYQAPNTPENRAKYLGRSVGGATQATGDSAVGANALKNQPTVTPSGVITNPGQGNTVPGPGTGGIGGGSTGGSTGGTGGGGTGGTGGTGIGGTSGTGIGGTGASGTGLDPATLTLIQSLQSQIASLTANTQQTAIDKAAADAAAKKERADNAILALTDRFSKYGLGSLIPKIRQLAISGASEDTIALQLQETDEYKQRFIGNEERIKKGLRVLDPGTYLGLEDRYRQIIRAYGLKQFDNDSYVTQFISNDVSPEELSSRVVNAVQRVQNADPAVSAMLRQYYNIGVTDMVAYVLDPNNQLPKIERQIGAAEIGVAAGRQGLTAGVNVAEQLAAQGVTEAEARRGYSTIADILPQATKLSQIYTGVLDQYNQAEAEQEVFNSLASAQRKRRALVEREIGSFSGASGLSKTALGRQTGGTY